MIARVALLVAVLLAAAAPIPAASVPSVPEGWEPLLAARVDDRGRVAYRAIALLDREHLSTALEEVANAELHRAGRDEIVTFWINTYNLAVVAAVLDGERPETLRGRARFYSWFRVEVAGESRPIDSIGAELERFAALDPRIRFALCDGSRGAPALAAEPFRPRTLDAQLARAARVFVRDPLRNRVDADPPALAALFRWHRAGFERAGGSILGYVTPFVPAEIRERWQDSPPAEPTFLEHDWRLNAAPGEEPEDEPENGRRSVRDTGENGTDLFSTKRKIGLSPLLSPLFAFFASRGRG